MAFLKLNEFVLSRIDRIEWEPLSANPSAIWLLSRNPTMIDWDGLSKNPNAMALLEANQDEIDWEELSKNTNAKAIALLDANPDMIDWDQLSENPSAIALLEANQDKLNWSWLSTNPSIFEYDYDAMKDHMYGSGICEALMANRFHPSNVDKWRGWGFEDMLPPPEIVKE